MVAGRVDLNHVAADDLEPAGEAPREFLGLAAGEASYLRRARPRRERGVDEVDVERVGRFVANYGAITPPWRPSALP